MAHAPPGTAPPHGVAPDAPDPMLLARVLARIRRGSLTIELPSGGRVTSAASRPGPDLRLRIADPRALRRLAAGGEIGFALSFLDGEWSSPDLPELLRSVAGGGEATGAAPGIARMRAALRAQAWLPHAWPTRRAQGPDGKRPPTPAGGAAQPWPASGAARADVALYADARLTLDEAQAVKHDRVVALLGARAGASVLEIGCGWGSLAGRLVESGCALTALTLSPAQEGFIRTRHAPDIKAGRLDLRLQDFRDVGGTFDAIASIEMVEALGEAHWPDYLGRLRALLRPGGRAVIQAITLRDHPATHAGGVTRAVETHVLPGGMLPSRHALAREIATAGLRVAGIERFGQPYAAAMAEWRSRFARASAVRRDAGVDPRALRKWEYFLAYCEGGLRSGGIDVGLYVLEHAALPGDPNAAASRRAGRGAASPFRPRLRRSAGAT